MNLQDGQIIGDYEVIGLLGIGGMGRVYKVSNILSGRIEAIKILHPDLRDSTEYAERFMREIKVHAGLEHPNIAALRTALRVENHVLMVMEFVEGKSLEQTLFQGPIPFWDCVNYACQILSALSYAHQKNVIHRDIKPANIMVTPHGVAKLMDFGIAKSAAIQKVTQTGMALGSLYYMSPEQVNAAPLDGRSDIYSLGVTLYQIATGRRPIEGDSEYAIMAAHLQKVPAPPHMLNELIPVDLSNVMLKALAKAPADRFQSADELRIALESLRTVRNSSTPRREVEAEPAASARLNPAILQKVQERLSRSIGPIAQTLIRRAAIQSASWPELLDTLAEHIVSEADRDGFLTDCRKAAGISRTASGSCSAIGGPAVDPTGDAPQPIPSDWNPVAIDEAGRRLAQYVGPVAKVLVNRATRKATTIEQLYQMLANEIESPKDRDRFLASGPL